MALVLLVCGLTACEPPHFTISIQPGSTRDQLVFLFKSGWFGGGGGLISDLRVLACPPAADAATLSEQLPTEEFWRISLPGSATIRTVRHGQPPDGFTVVSGPTPLRPGCYVLKTDRPATNEIRFQVNPDGTIDDGRDPTMAR